MPQKRPPIWPEPGPILVLQGSLSILPPSVNEAYKIVKVPKKQETQNSFLFSRTWRRKRRSPEEESVQRIGATQKLEDFKRDAAYTLKKHDAWYRHEDLLSILRSKKVREQKQKEPLLFYLLTYYPSLWKRDIDGGMKFVQDAVCAEMGVNDATTIRMLLDKRAFDEKDALNVPRCEISVFWLDHIPPVLGLPSLLALGH